MTKKTSNAVLRFQRDEKEFFSMMEALPYGIMLIKMDKEIYFANTIAKEMTGYNFMEGHLCFDTFCDKKECECPVERNENIDISRRRIRRKDGSTLPVLKSAQRIFFNNIEYYLEVLTDITRQVSTEDKLLEKSRELEAIIKEKEIAEKNAQDESRKFESLFEEVADALFVHDYDDNFIKVNRKMCDRLGYSRKEFADMKITEIEAIKPSLKAKARIQHLNKERNMTYETLHITRDGSEVPVEIHSQVIEFEGKEVILSSARNITQRKIHDKLLTKATKRAEESDRLKSRFLNNISHEIRTPLNGIVGFLDLLEDDNIPNEQKKEYISIMRRSSERLIETVHTIIDISKIESSSTELKKERFDLYSVIQTLAHETSAKYANSEIEFSWDLSPDLENKGLETHRENFMLILKHLISNAFKFTIKGSVKLHITIVNDNLEITISDTGIGIRKQDMQLIFKPFRKSEDSERLAIEGNGLGLTLAAKLANQLGGNILVSSEYGKGSEFTVTLPEVIVHDPQQENFLVPMEDLQNKTILIAEDDASNFMYLDAVLQEKGCKILHAHNGEQAVNFFLNGHKIDLILMDLGMPVMDGFTATKKIKAVKNEIPIIAHSAYVLNSEKERAMEAGCDDFLPKPVKPDQLIASIQKHLLRGDSL